MEIPYPVWTPTPEFIATTNLAWLMHRIGVASYADLHDWSVRNQAAYWEAAIERLGVRFQRPYDQILDVSDGVENPRWLTGARLNIVESCFANADPDAPSIIHQREGGELTTLTVGELKTRVERVSACLGRRGFQPGDALAIYLPMTVEAVAIYLGIVQAGCVAVGIADSLRSPEIAARLRLAGAKAIFTADVLRRGGKTFPLYVSVCEAAAVPAIVLPGDGTEIGVSLREQDICWSDFMHGDDFDGESRFEAVARTPDDPITLLFSSGTTGEPKAIPWTHTTPIKCAADAHFHQNVQPGDVLVWPTSLGWMMGPWLLFSALMNRAAIGLYCGAPTGRDFGQFVQNCRATLLGVVPSLVRVWRDTNCMEQLDWSEIKVFSSTGECSCAADMVYLSSLAGGRPIIEYCGGTEIGGGYLTGVVTLPCVPGTFNAPALGIGFVILDENGQPSNNGELFLVPPSLGLSTTLLNADHHRVYFADTPPGPDGKTLRRHGDQMETLPGGYWRGHGRADDTMNLGGIKVSSAEIERTLQSVAGLIETAAIAVPPGEGGGPSRLTIYAVCDESERRSVAELRAACQNAIKQNLNPLFKIHDVVVISSLPRTASNKVMRRSLRDRYQESAEPKTPTP